VVVSLLKAVLLLFLLKTAAQFFFYAADGVSARVSDGIEKGLILSTFGALLRRPLAFFALRPSGALVKQVAQIDSVAPIVSALSRDLLPETFRVVATVSVMLTVHPRLTAIALATIPAYAWVSWRMARRLEAGLDRSVGERQRLLLARALLARPCLLVLDEATANLDVATEVEVKRALARARGNRTMLVIARRFSMVEDADHVIVLDRGQVVEQGTVEELRSAGGWFARFAHSAAGADGR